MVNPASLLPASRSAVVAKAAVEVAPDRDTAATRLIYAYLGSATFWLLVGTLVGAYLGLKFATPDIDHIPWLSYGRLRPVHTNTVFWGWASLAMIALALYVVPKTSRRPLHSLPLAWVSLGLINAAVLVGDLLLMSGVNNGGQEYREYIWPVQGVFALGVILVTYNMIRTIVGRAIEEIYISNWYIMGGFLWTVALMVIAYVPFYQQTGISETVIQGFYMHMGVGMWFTPMVLGLTYYFLPKLLNKPIYSYSLGVLAFWTQMVFYSMIGAHHFIFAPTPWWLQTVAIIFSVGMIVTLAAGTGNFLMTMKGSFRTVARSYSLPFILVGVIAYFLFSLQGTFEAFRSLNRVWHFTNFTIAHSHLTMYGFVVFLIWGGIYGLVPRLTGREPSHFLAGVHFWFAFVGVAIYTIALMVGGTMQGMSWIAGDAFIDSVTMMAPFWLWRALGGGLMFLSHLIFAYNLWCMRPSPHERRRPLEAQEAMA
ncbi:cbb3-type cytochrome c oxidase subunit I [Halomonas sp. M20]|uniref:cbb3-type cytochrome c oxidase subunit I n=1 Tax=Halomonas sp. M20 TaxID=2763264 RepID=UPI001D0B149B|nr:cbb3-type cytochrome c oxidase subunit I [Halomonas sp. M20]